MASKEVIRQVTHLILTSASLVPKNITHQSQHHLVRRQSLQVIDPTVTPEQGSSSNSGINVTARVTNFYMNQTDNEIHIPGSEQLRAILLRKSEMGKFINLLNYELRLEFSWADVSLSMLVDCNETSFIFGLDESNQPPMLPSATSIVNYRVNEFRKSFVQQTGETDVLLHSRASRSNSVESVPIDSTRVDNDIPESIILESAKYGSFETGFFDVREILQKLIVEERIKDTIVARMHLNDSPKYNLFKSIDPRLKSCGPFAEVIKPGNVKVIVPMWIHKLVLTFSVGYHRRTVILDEMEPFSILVINKYTPSMGIEPRVVPNVVSLLALKEAYKAKKIKIIKADYKYLDNNINVTEKLQTLVSHSSLYIPADHKNFLFQVDPALKFEEKRMTASRILSIDFQGPNKQVYHAILHDNEALFVLCSEESTQQQLNVRLAEKVTRHSAGDVTRKMNGRVHDNVLHIPMDLANWKDKLSENIFRIPRRWVVLLEFAKHKCLWTGMLGYTGLKVIALQSSPCLEPLFASKNICDGSPDQQIATLPTLTPPPLTRVSSSLSYSPAVLPQTQSISCNPAPITSPNSSEQLISFSPQLSSTNQDMNSREKICNDATSFLSTSSAPRRASMRIIDGVGVDTVHPQEEKPTVAIPEDERIELFKIRPSDVSIVERSRKQEQFQSPIMQVLLGYLDAFKITFNTSTLTLGDLFCVLLSQPFLLLMLVVWCVLTFNNSSWGNLLAASYTFLRVSVSFVWTSLTDTVFVGACIFVYSLFTSPPFAVWIKSKIRQEYEEFLIIKRARDSTLGKIAKNATRWLLNATHDANERAASAIGVDLRTTNVGVQNRR